MQDRAERARVTRPWLAVTAVIVATLVVAAACGSSSDDNGGQGAQSVDVTQPVSGDVVTGGKLVYGVEAETSGFDPTTDRWAVSGNDIAFAIYDPLAAYDAEGNVQPYLASSFEPSADYRTWTINIRPNIEFHNGQPLNAAAVVLAMQGIQNSTLTGGAFRAIDTISAVPGNDLAVQVTMRQPWASFPATLVGQAGVIPAPEQLQGDAQTKSRRPIGTGPFVYENWVTDSAFTAKKNPNYWMKDEQGRPLPYLDEVEFRPLPDAQTRVASLTTNDISMLHTSSDEFIQQLRSQAANGEIQVMEDRGENEEAFIMLNSSAPPFDNPTARQALAYATDIDAYLAAFQIDPEKRTNSPFSKDSPYYSDNPYPSYDPQRAEDLVQQYQQETGQPLAFTLGTTPVETNRRLTQLLQQQWNSVGMQVEIRETEQSTFIVDAVQGKYQANTWRQFGANDPDADYVWWHQSNATGALALNIARFQNQEVSDALDAARATPDEAERARKYAIVQRVWGEQGPYIWLNTTTWLIAAQNNIRDFWNNPLPSADNVASIPAMQYQSGSQRLTATWIES